MTEENQERRVRQPRIEERADCDIEARVELSNRLAIACRLRDLSSRGFKIQIDAAVNLPDEFDLLVPVIEDTFQRFRVRKAWRKDDLVGGEFISASL